MSAASGSVAMSMSNIDIAPGHAAERCMQRYGLPLTVADMRQITLDITDAVLGIRHAAILQEKRADGSEIWFVSVRGVAMRVGYHPTDAAVATVLPWRRKR